MAGRKRSSDEAAVGPRGAAAKAARKTSPEGTRKGGKKGPKAIAASAFKARALPLHVNLTHTPPSIADEDTVPAATADPGFLGAVALVPSSFATGSYGWKGSKRLTVELSDPDGGEETEKVHVMLTINATVMGSKQAKEADDAEAAAEGEHPDTKEHAEPEEHAELEEHAEPAEPVDAPVELVEEKEVVETD